MDMQKHLTFLVNLIITRDLELGSANLRGVTAFWRESDQTACLTFYYDGLGSPLSDNELDEYSDLEFCNTVGTMQTNICRFIKSALT